jgi:hypothetical protein
MSCYLFSPESLPEGFVFPPSFLAFVAKEPIPYLEPWWFLCEFQKSADFWLAETHRQYPDRKLIPFAKKSGTDDVACFDGASRAPDPKVYYVHAFASPGWEDRGSASNFAEWLQSAEKESIEYKADQAS